MRGQDFDLWCKMYANNYIGYVLEDVLFDYYEDRNKLKEVKLSLIHILSTLSLWALPRRRQ